MINRMSSGYIGTPGRSDASVLPSAMRVLRERWWIIVLTAVVGVGVALVVAKTTTKSYQATAKVLIQPSSPISGAVVAGGGSTEDPTRIAATDLLLVTSNAVGNATRQSLGLKMSTGDLLDEVTASEEPNADLFDITATDVDATRAAKIANGVAAQFALFLGRIVQQDATAAAAELQQRLASLPKSDTVDIAQIHGELQRVYELAASQAGSATVVGTASVPTTASSPKPKLYVALGLIFGLGLGAGLAFLVDLGDRRIKDDEGFETAYGLGTLVHVPLRSLSGAGAQPGSPASEPYRILAATLTSFETARGVRSVLITSAVAREGKTTVAAGLAMALADSGVTVSLVELDQRLPSLQDHFPLNRETGLTTTLVNGEPVGDLLQQPVPSLPSLHVLPSGPRLTTNPLELLRSPELDRVMAQLLDVSQIVIYDAPPILGIADAQALLDHPRIDAAVIVGRANATTREEARRARTILDQRLVKPLGLVITGLDGPGADTAYYYAGSGPDGSARRAQRRADQPPAVAPGRRSGV
jgi:succinoglycan biosynthesis transport protein ExoP